MHNFHFELENIKCGGCAKSIKNKLSELTQVSEVLVDFEKGTVDVTLENDTVSREEIAEKLASMGYPETGKNNLVHKAVSYVSCAVGKFS